MWKNILLKHLSGTCFRNSKTILNEKRKYQHQLFEVLITETLAVIDPSICWTSLPIGHDNGIDFIGEVREIKSPYLLQARPQIILGQIKRRADGYRKDSFHYDIIKIIEHYNQNLASHKILLQIIHVLSTDKNIDASKWLENASYPYVQYHISPINALDFFRFWKINNSFFIYILEGTCSKQETAELLAYINSVESNWSNLIHSNLCTEHFSYIGDDFFVNIEFTSEIDLTLNFYAVWKPSEQDKESCIALVYPNNMINSGITKYRISLYKRTVIRICMRAYRSGKYDLGQIVLFSESGDLIEELPMGEITIHNGIVPYLYEAPYADLLASLKKDIINNSSSKKCFWAITGQGGIGKTSLSKELLLFAMNHGYYSIAIQCSNDTLNTRKAIFDLFRMLITQTAKDIYVYENLFELIRNFMGVNFNSNWSETVMKYVLGDEIINSAPVMECFMTLLIMISAKSPLFIWISDMHWASKHEIDFFRRVIFNININQQYFSNKLYVVFEGRDNETLIIENKTFFPYEWLQFIELEDIKRIKLTTWSTKHCKEFIQMLTNPHQHKEYAINERNLKLQKNIFKQTAGNPMHIKEYLRSLIEHKKVEVLEDGTLELTGYLCDTKLPQNSIIPLIQVRIQFYHEKFSDIIDFYIILSSLTTNLTALYEWYVTNKLSSTFDNYNLLEKEIGIIRKDLGEIIFTHEFYKETLKEQKICSNALILQILQYFETFLKEENNDQASMDLITLKTMVTPRNYEEIYQDTIYLLQNSKSDPIRFKCYEIILTLPHKYRNKLTLSAIYFDMSQIAIRISSWKNSRKYLEKVIEMDKQAPLEQLYYIMACKDLANILGVSIHLQESIRMCNKGLEKVQRLLKYPHLYDATLREELNRQHEMLLNRIAVTYWFSGQCAKSDSYFNEAMQLAQERKDQYAIAHTMYETGMRLLHDDVDLGTKKISEALEMLPPQSRFTEKQEHHLVEVELLLGKILIYEKTRDLNLLCEILEKSDFLCSMLKVGNANYESALCHIIKGICHILQGEHNEALQSFYISVDCSSLGEMKTVLWKAYLNISQTFLLLYEKDQKNYYQEQAIQYAKKSDVILQEAVLENPDVPQFHDLIYLPHQRICNILNRDNKSSENKNSQKPLFVSFEQHLFFIMD